jgi:hypothetical protein
MAKSSDFATSAQRQSEELWNVSLFPLSFGAVPTTSTVRALENVDDRRSLESFRRPLRVSPRAVSVILP